LFWYAWRVEGCLGRVGSFAAREGF
jgi:hypothetical protein